MILLQVVDENGPGEARRIENGSERCEFLDRRWLSEHARRECVKHRDEHEDADDGKSLATHVSQARIGGRTSALQPRRFIFVSAAVAWKRWLGCRWTLRHSALALIDPLPRSSPY